MKIKYLFTVCFIIHHSSFILSTHAQDAGFTYQGRLNDGASPANGSYDLTFALYDAVSGPAQVGNTLTNSTTGVSNGLFTVTLDFGNQFPGADRWLEIGVRKTGSLAAFTTLAPRQLISPTPYALHADTTAGVASNAVSNAALAPDAVTANKIAPGQVVKSFNGLSDDIQLAVEGELLLRINQNQIVLAVAPPNCNTYSNCYWNLLGNGNLTAGVNYLGTIAGELAPLEFRVNNNRSLLHTFTAANTSPNILGGYRDNVVTGTGGTISGGGQAAGINHVSANWGTVSGGVSNAIQSASTSGTISGGASNQIVGFYGAIGGGVLNVASNYAFVGGGNRNRSLSDGGFIGGGTANLITTYVSGLATIPAVFSTISGGVSNAITGGNVGTIGGGQHNRLTGSDGRQVDYATIAGGQGNAVLSDMFSSHYSTIGGGLSNRISEAGRATIGGGEGNRMLLEAHNSTISGGVGNTVDGPYGTISGGRSNLVFGPGNPDYATIGGGNENAIVAESHYATVAGGRRNRIEGFANHSSIGGGMSNNIVTADFGLIGGGGSNSVTGDYGTVPGGRLNRAQGSDSFAAGRRAVAQHDGTFVWADDTDADFTSIATEEFAVRASGGVRIIGSSTNGSLMVAPNETISGDDSQILLAEDHDGTFGMFLRYDGLVNELQILGKGGMVSGPHLVIARDSGNVGIKRSSAANDLEVEGTASKTAAGSWLANSDARIKKDVEPVTGALAKLSQVRLVSFRYTDDYRLAHDSIEDRPYLNVVAQEFREVFPDHVKSSGEKLPDGSEILQVDTYPLTIYAAAAVQELNGQMKTLKSEMKRRDTENAELKQRNVEMEIRLSALEKLMNHPGVAQGGAR